MTTRLMLLTLGVLLSGCAGFPTANPPDESFTETELEEWQAAESEAPQKLVGTWRLIDERSTGSTELLWFEFTEAGLFSSGVEKYYTQKVGQARWQGAYRVSEKILVCHYQQKDGDDSWLKSRGGKGEVWNYPFYFKDRDTLVLQDVTKQKLTIKYHRAVGRANN